MELFPREWIDRIIATQSETDRSNLPLAQWLRTLVEQSGLQCTFQTVREEDQDFVNLIGFNQRPDHPDLLVLNTHLDTVSGGDPSRWTKTGGDPWKATWVRDRVYGLGTADVKIDFLCKLWAIRQAKIQRPIALVGTYGEERGLIGVQKLLDGRAVTPRYALVGEPSNMELIYAHKGHLVACASLALEKGVPVHSRHWIGKAAHSSTPALGVNALAKAFSELSRHPWGLAQLEGGSDFNKVPESAKAGFTEERTQATIDFLDFVRNVEALAKDVRKTKDRRFSPSATTLSWNLCRTGAGRAQLWFDMRTLPAVDPSALAKRVEKLLPRSGRWEQITADPPLAGTKDSPLMRAATKALRAVGVKPVAKTKASSTEAAIYNRHGAQALVFGPSVSVGNVHKPNEHALLSQVRKATEFYKQFLEMPWEGQ